MGNLWTQRVRQPPYFIETCTQTLFRLFKQLAIYTAYFILVFICFLLRPTPLERENGEVLLCIMNLPHVNYNKMTGKSIVCFAR